MSKFDYFKGMNGDALMAFWFKYQQGRNYKKLFPNGGKGAKRAAADLANIASNLNAAKVSQDDETRDMYLNIAASIWDDVEKSGLMLPTRPNRIKPARRTIGMPSQREHINPKTGKATKKPSARLMARREKDTIPGYYPNPAPSRGIDPERLRKELLAYAQSQIRSVEAGRAGAKARDTYAAYIDGILFAGVVADVITPDELDDTMSKVRKAWNLE